MKGMISFNNQQLPWIIHLFPQIKGAEINEERTGLSNVPQICAMRDLGKPILPILL